MAINLRAKLPVVFMSLFLLLAVSGFAYLNILQSENARKARKIDNNLVFNTIVVPACEIFSVKDAQKLLNKNVEIEDTTIGAENTADIDVSACSYSVPFRTIDELAKAKTASVLLRTPKNIKGANINHQAFTVDLPAKAEAIEGYGQQAFWNAERSQLNVYKDGNWLIFSSGSLRVNERTLDETKKLADTVMPKI